MKFLTFIVLLMLVLAQFLKADASIERFYGAKIIKTLGNNTHILCVEGYQWIAFQGSSPQQMFEKHTTTYSPDINMLPISCK